jgi:hypothetical protein
MTERAIRVHRYTLTSEIEVPVDAMASMARKFSAVGGGAECESLQQRAARALQAVADGGEAGDHRFDDDLVLVVAVTGQDDSTVAANMFTHDPGLAPGVFSQR